MNLVLFDSDIRQALLPLTFTRPVAEIRCGILTIREKWEKRLEMKASFKTETYLSGKYSLKIGKDNLYVNGAVCPDFRLTGRIIDLKTGEALVYQNEIIATRLSGEQAVEFPDVELKKIQWDQETTLISRPWHIFQHNAAQLERDFKFLTDGRTSQPMSSTNTVMGDALFLEPGAVVEGATINTKTGPVYIGKDAEVMEGSLIRGGLALCEHSTLKMGAKIYGATTVGPHSKVGGEVNNAVIFGYSNKGHDGFLGNAVLGEWVNIGADSNNSNLKNNYDEVKLWDYREKRFVRTGLQFCGLIMGDHSKCGINTMFNTGTVVGVSANIFGSGFPRNFIPSFSWGGAGGYMVYLPNKAIDTAKRMMERRNIGFTEDDRSIFEHIFETTKGFRNF